MSLMVQHDDTRERQDVAAARAGDEAAFARLYDRHAAVVWSLCRRAGQTSADAEDATQETFIRAHRMLDRLDGTGRIRPWLYAIARRVCSERRRSDARRRQHEDAMKTQSAQATMVGVRADAVNEAAQLRERQALLSAALDELDPRERLAIHLHYLEEDPANAARHALDLSRSGYYKLLARARERLAVFMQEVQA